MAKNDRWLTTIITEVEAGIIQKRMNTWDIWDCKRQCKTKPFSCSNLHAITPTHWLSLNPTSC
jgi:hypothetical protein